MAKKLNKLDLQVLTSVDTAPTGFVALAAKSDGLYQKVGTVESKLSTTAELLDRVKTAVPLNAKFTDTNTTYGIVTTAANGLMIAADKVKLNGIEEGANKYVHPSGVYMSSAERTKLAGIATSANNYSLPIASGTVLGGIKVGTRLSIASGVLSATQQTANDFTTVLKNKLDGIATGANNYVHPSAHPISFITGLQSALNEKSNTGHTHSHITSTRYDTNDPKPSQLVQGLSFQFSYPDGGWHNAINMRSYHDSNYLSTQIVSSANNPGADTGYSYSLRYREGRNETWLGWKTIWDNGNLTTLSQLTDNIGVASHIANKANPHSVTKAQVGLGNVDNTSDLLKPISNAVQTALNLKFDKTGGRLTAGIGDVNIELWRGTNASWNILNSGGYLRFQSNYTTVVGAYFDALKLDYNTGNALFKGTVTAPTFIGALSGNASSATTLATARTIGGVSFNGSANINLPGVNTAGNQNTSGTAAKATILATTRAINGTNFNGSAAITTALWGTSRTLSFTGDVTGSSSVNGSANVATAMTLANVATAGTYRSVTINAKGLVTSGTNPTTLGGYGITDAVTTNTTQSITGTKTFTKRIGANLGVKIGTHSTDGLIEWDATNNAFKFNGSVYATGGISALGLGDGGGSSGGGGADMLDSWANYTEVKADYYVPSSLLVPFRNDALGRLNSLESDSATSITTTGSGNAITSITKSGNVITASKGSLFALSTHTHTVATTSANGLMSSTDKSKLNGIATGANNYVHPSSHPASIITQTASARFVTDVEKSNWNAKIDANKFQVVTSLPTSPTAGVFYFIKE